MSGKMLVLADDFTGALDTGIHFAKSGAKTRVVTDPAYDLEKTDAEVLVIDTETRHQSPENAAVCVSSIARRAREHGFTRFYKKTDSAMRGNAGAETAALLSAVGGTCVHFLPSFPKMNRVVRDGILYIDEVPVADSVFGRDPFEPVLTSDVKELLESQTDVPVSVVDDVPENPAGIIVYNAQTDAQILDLAKRLPLSEDPVILAGCAGLASCLTKLLPFSGQKPVCLEKSNGFLVVSGSVNEVTKRQIAKALAAGFSEEHLGNREKLTDFLRTDRSGSYRELLLERIRKSSSFVIHTDDREGEETAASWGAAHGMDIKAVGNTIADTLAFLVFYLLEHGLDRTLLLTGGDVLYHTMQGMGIRELNPLDEVSPGVILSTFCFNGKEYPVLTKSGGFGDEDLLVRLAANPACAGLEQKTF